VPAISAERPIPQVLSIVRRACASGQARSIRESSRLYLTEVADHVGVSVQTISAWERGLQQPSLPEFAYRYLDLLERLAGEELT
jgi:DNA-binding transcriptional regulator YiaG